MAYICNCNNDCANCKHYRYDEDMGEMACWAEIDEEEELKERSKLTRDEHLKLCMSNIQLLATEWINYVNQLNQCAYTDRGIETLLEEAEELLKIYMKEE